MNTGRRRIDRIQPLGNPGKIQIWVVADDASDGTCRSRSLRQDDGAGAGGKQFFMILWVGEEADLVRTGPIQRRDLSDRPMRLAYQLAAQASDDFLESDWSHNHIKTLA